MRIATCQFPVSANIKRNFEYMKQQIRQAYEQRAKLVHFGECALSGYCGPDFESWADYDWKLLRQCTQEIMQLADDLSLWIIFGSNHQLSDGYFPYNCLYVIDDIGQLVTRYDKQRCSMRDLNNYSPSDVHITFEVAGIKFGLLICLDYRFPELYHQYMELGVDCILHSFHDANKQSKTLSTMIAPPTLQGHSGNYVLWLSVANNSKRYQAFPSMFINPMGEIEGKAKRHISDILINEIDFAKHGEYVKMVRAFRAEARSGEVYRSKYLRDSSSTDRTKL